jgi:peptidoglycan/xylan/chitin deacetylase (PgdA/CDA1 family)
MKKTFKRLIKVAISAVLFVFDLVRAFFPGNKGPRCVILYYHSLPKHDTEAFGRQMDLLLSVAKPIADIDEISPDANGRFGMVTFDDGYESVMIYALPQLQVRTIPCTIFIPTGSIGKKPAWISDGAHPFFAERVIDPGQIRQLASDTLVTIGSHGVSHSNRLTYDEFQNEAVESKKVLEALTGKAVTLFSFPHGRYETRNIGQLRNAGYQRAFSIDPAIERPGARGFVLGRVAVHLSDWNIEFFLKISGAYRWQSWKPVWRKHRG